MQTLIVPALQHAFPDRVQPVVTSFEKLEAGWECEVFSFRMSYSLSGSPERLEQDLILRAYPGDGSSVALRKAEWEYRVLSALAQAGYPVPSVYYLHEGDTPAGQPFVVMEKIEGRPMWALLYDPARHRSLIETFCRLFVELHALDWRLLTSEPAPDWPATPTGLIDRQLESFLPITQALPLPGFAPVMDWVQAHKWEAGGMRPSITHWDFHPNNILVSDDGAARVIDWTSTGLTDYRFDLAWTLLLTESYAGTDLRNEILREYERQAGSPVEHLDFYEVAAAVRRLYTVIASVVYGPEKLGMRQDAVTAMLRQKEAQLVVYRLLRERTGLRIKEVEEVLGSGD